MRPGRKKEKGVNRRASQGRPRTAGRTEMKKNSAGEQQVP